LHCAREDFAEDLARNAAVAQEDRNAAVVIYEAQARHPTTGWEEWPKTMLYEKILKDGRARKDGGSSRDATAG
jgi:hypothetical protein